jgi:flagellar biosynthesis/type III secretory pathway protein FliH
MSSRFKNSGFDKLKPEQPQGPSSRIVKGEAAVKTTVSSFQLDKLRKTGPHGYQETKAKYGALAATDADRQARTQKDKGFHLSPLLREPLAVEAEEQRAIQERVDRAIADISERTRAEASRKGYQQGLEKGYTEAFQRFKKEADGHMTRIEAILHEMEEAKHEVYRANEQFLVEMIFRVARMVMLKELSADKEYLMRLTRELVERVGVKDNIRIRLNPNDILSMELVRENLEKTIGAMKNLHIEESKEVGIGGCIVETEWNAIDASIETQLQGIRNALISEAK